MSLILSRALYDDLRTHGEEIYPNECCGILLGRADTDAIRVTSLLRAGNTRTDSAHNRYHIAPEELIAAQRQARNSGLDIVGFYHSHPDHPAQWSPTDFAEAHWIGCSYVITEVAGGKAAVTNSFRLAGETEENKRFEPDTIVVEEESIGKPGC